MKLINPIFKTFFLLLSIIAQVHFAYAVDQSIIPNGKATFLDQNGKPLTNGKVFFYSPSSTTPKTTYQDIGGTIPNAQPIVLDAAGRALIWGTGNYRQQVFDRNNNLIWDVTTSAAGSGSSSGPTGTGDGDAVGTIKPWAGATAPNQYMFTFGQEVSRTSFAPLYQAITSQQPVFCTSGSPTLTGLSNTDSFWIGMPLEVACIVTGSTTVISKTSSSVTMATNANLTTNTTATFFMWGRGNGSTTFNLPDYRGLIPMGNNIMGGTASSNISDANFGSQSASSAGGQGGTQTTSITLLTVNLPPYTPAGTVATTWNFNSAPNPPSGGGNIPTTGTSYGNVQPTFTSTFTGTPQGGTSTPIVKAIIPPSKTINYIIKVTPDSTSTGTGVTSLGGMTGDIACGTGITCSGATISVSSVLNLTVGASIINSGTNTRVLFDNSGTLGEYAITGTGNVALNNGPTFITPILGVATGTSLALGGCTIGANVFCTTGNINFNGSLAFTSASQASTTRTSTGLNIDQATSTGDANYVILSTDRTVYHSALSAARTDTLPAANAVNTGQTLLVSDPVGVASATKTVTLQRAGSDTVNGGTTFIALSSAFGMAVCVSDGTSKWNCQPFAGGTSSGTVTSITPGSGLVSSTSASCSQTAITTSGTLSKAECINAQTGTTYAIVDGDRAKLITASNAAAQAYTIAQAGTASNFANGWYTDITNISTNANGIVTITATTSTFPGGVSTYILKPSSSVRIISDGTNYQTALSFFGPATKADQQAGTSAITQVTPSQQQSHDSAAKAWCLFTGATTGTHSCTIGYNVTSITRSSTGTYTLNFTTAFASSSSYSCVGTQSTSSTNGFIEGNPTGLSSSAWPLFAINTGGATFDPTTAFITCYGQQ